MRIITNYESLCGFLYIYGYTSLVMKRLLLLLIILFSTIISFGQTPVFEWAKGMGGSFESQGYSIVSDSLGNVYSVGYFKDTIDFDPGIGVYNLVSIGYFDTYILKLDANGDFVWAKQFGGATSRCYGYDIALDSSNNVYTVGQFQGIVDFNPSVGIDSLNTLGYDNAFVSKLDANGNFVWAKMLGDSSYSYGRAIDIDALGDVYSIGYYSGFGDFDPGVSTYDINFSGGYDIFISKLDNNGNFVWAKQVGGNYDDYGSSISIKSNGNIIIAGSFQNWVDFDPGSGTFDMAPIGLGAHDVFVEELDGFGNFIWAKSFGGSDTESGKATLDEIDNIYLTGYYKDMADFDPGVGVFNMTPVGSYDIFISKLDQVGNFLWAKSIGGPSIEFSYSLITDGSGNVYTVGAFNATVDFDPGLGIANVTSFGNYDMFISKLDLLGNYIWVSQIGGSQGDYCNSISLDVNNNIYTTGYFKGVADFDPGAGIYNLTSVSSVSQENAFVHKMSQPPVGINEYNSNNSSISLFPNPTSSNIIIETTKPTSISIVNIVGQELFASKIEKSQKIDISFLSNGIYFVKDLNNGGSVKFIKQ